MKRLKLSTVVLCFLFLIHQVKSQENDFDFVFPDDPIVKGKCDCVIYFECDENVEAGVGKLDVRFQGPEQCPGYPYFICCKSKSNILLQTEENSIYRKKRSPQIGSWLANQAVNILNRPLQNILGTQIGLQQPMQCNSGNPNNRFVNFGIGSYNPLNPGNNFINSGLPLQNQINYPTFPLQQNQFQIPQFQYPFNQFPTTPVFGPNFATPEIFGNPIQTTIGYGSLAEQQPEVQTNIENYYPVSQQPQILVTTEDINPITESPIPSYPVAQFPQNNQITEKPIQQVNQDIDAVFGNSQTSPPKTNVDIVTVFGNTKPSVPNNFPPPKPSQIDQSTLDEIFNTRDTSVSVDVKSGAKKFDKDGDECSCVIYYLCDEKTGQIITDGAGVIDVRFTPDSDSADLCPGEEPQLCCKLPKKGLTSNF